MKISQAPVQAAKLAHDMAKQNLSEAQIALRGIESELDDSVEPDSDYGRARKSHREATAKYEKAKIEAEAAANAKKFKDVADRFKFVQNDASLSEARAKRAATSKHYAAERQEVLEGDNQWKAVKAAMHKRESGHRQTEIQMKSAVAAYSRARADEAEASRAISKLQQLKRISAAQDKKRAAQTRQTQNTKNKKQQPKKKTNR
jgi:hypothetical protein